MLKFLVTAIAAFSISTASAQVVVSSKIDTEGGVLGNLILHSLKHAGIQTENRLQLGGTPVLREAIKAGEIDIYPDYTGNAAFFFNMADKPIWKNADQAYATAKKLDYDRNKIVWLPPASANNTWAIALRKEVAEQHGLSTLSDFGKWIHTGGKIKLVASAEFVNSPAALPAFQKAYGFDLKTDQMIVLSGGDTAATIRAAAQQTNGANAAMVYGTDGAIAAAGLMVLTDDKSVQPIYQPAALIREATLKRYPRIAEILKPVFDTLDLNTLQQLNRQVQLEGRPASEVAKSYLEAHRYFSR
jgi:osmoprotectant transport system substrate-binding protein